MLLGSPQYFFISSHTCVCRFGSAELKKEFLLPSIMGDKVACLGVSEVGAGSDVSSTSRLHHLSVIYYHIISFLSP